LEIRCDRVPPRVALVNRALIGASIAAVAMRRLRRAVLVRCFTLRGEKHPTRGSPPRLSANCRRGLRRINAPVAVALEDW
jgi:hypothetical protein